MTRRPPINLRPEQRERVLALAHPMTGPGRRLYKEIADEVGCATFSVSRLLNRHGLARRPRPRKTS
jgi:hypothetical protein